MLSRGYERLTSQLKEAITTQAISGKRVVIPEAGILLWQVFTALCRTRSYSQWGSNPITYQEIEAWARLSRMPLQPHHVDILIQMDSAWLEAVGKGEKPQKAALTPALFDAAMG
ncbi:phage tail assembly chaperone [Shimia sediminis]|uniref:phage tail assembly chaperone n=1 Tax=Shimia sediminis TaxID=2497945 RepID=UPI003F677911